jgi:TPR repeat protein
MEKLKKKKKREVSKMWMLSPYRAPYRACLSAPVPYQPYEEIKKKEEKVFISLEDIFYSLNIDPSNLSEYKKYEKEIIHIFNGGKEILPNDAKVALNMLGIYEAKVKKNYENAIKFYTESSSLGNHNSMYNLGLLYYEMNKMKESKKYLSLAMDQGHAGSFSYLASIFDNIDNNFEEAEKYYKMSIDTGDILGIYNYGASLWRRNRKEEAKLYFKKYIQYGVDVDISPTVINNIMKAFNDIELYQILSTSLPVKDHLKNEWSRLLNKPTVNAYINKINTFKRLNNYNACNICFEEKLNINYACGHEVCVDCYARLNGKCHFCKM